MENALAVANYFLGKSFETGEPVTPMKLVKLVYLAHGWHLGLTGQPLLAEPVQAWQYGPVVKSVYHEFKKFGGEPITDMAAFSNGFGQPHYYQVTNADEVPFLEHVWDVYRNYNALQLSALTHQPGTPWEQVWNERGGNGQKQLIIPNELIRRHYEEKINANQAAAA
jgi:uncharacterized phage-associated protein